MSARDGQALARGRPARRIHPDMARPGGGITPSGYSRASRPLRYSPARVPWGTPDRRKEKATDRRLARWLSFLGALVSPFSAPAVALAADPAFDVALTVEAGAPGLPPTLPVTGSPILLLIALLLVLVTAGSASLAAAEARERAATEREE